MLEGLRVSEAYERQWYSYKVELLKTVTSRGTMGLYAISFKTGVEDGRPYN